MNDEKLAQYTFIVAFVAALIYALIINIGGFKDIIGVFLLIGLLFLIYYSNEVAKKMISSK